MSKASLLDKLTLKILISLILACLYVGINFARHRSMAHFEAALEVPMTFQGEIADLYRKSPFKALRIAFNPGETFTQAGFIISTSIGKTVDQVRDELMAFLSKYYKTRKPYVTFVEPDLASIKNLNESIELTKHEVEVSKQGLETLKKKYGHFLPGAFLLNEERIVEKELSIISQQAEIDRLKFKPQLSELKLNDIRMKPILFLSLSLFMKAGLIFMLSLLAQIFFLRRKHQA